MGCNCNKNKQMWEVVDADGKLLFGPSPFRTTVDAMSARNPGSTVREVQKVS